MRRVVVAVCGSPKSGKMTLLRSIALLTGSEQLELWCKPWESRARLVVDLPGMKVVFVTVTGLFFFDRTDIVDEIVQYADVVVYLSSTLPPKESEFVYFACFRDSAKRLGKMWDEIPWLFVLNVFEGRNEPVLPQMIPREYQGDILMCNAATPTDIQRVWEALLVQPPLVVGEGGSVEDANACQEDREATMNWTYDRANQQWTLRAGPWRATVVPMRDSDAPADRAPQWLALITHRDRPAERRESPLLAWPDEARAWCLTELARLRAEEGGQGG